MSYLALGEPHSLRRYIEFGIIAGSLAGIISTVLGVNLLLLGTAATAIAVWLAGRGGRTGEPASSERSPPAFEFHRRSQVFSSPVLRAAICFAIFAAAGSFVSKAGNYAVADSGLWILLFFSIMCFGALVVLNR